MHRIKEENISKFPIVLILASYQFQNISIIEYIIIISYKNNALSKDKIFFI